MDEFDTKQFIESARNSVYCNDFVKSCYAYFQKYGKLSDKQIRTIHSIISPKPRQRKKSYGPYSQQHWLSSLDHDDIYEECM